MADVIIHPGAAAAPRRQSVLARIAAVFAVWRQRRALADLPEHLRHDVGLSETEIRREIHRPLWDVPNYWRV